MPLPWNGDISKGNDMLLQRTFVSQYAQQRRSVLFAVQTRIESCIRGKTIADASFDITIMDIRVPGLPQYESNV